MFHVGLDIHSNRISICVLNETGQIVLRSQVRTVEQLIRTLQSLPDRFQVCYEASCRKEDTSQEHHPCLTT